VLIFWVDYQSKCLLFTVHEAYSDTLVIDIIIFFWRERVAIKPRQPAYN